MMSANPARLVRRGLTYPGTQDAAGSIACGASHPDPDTERRIEAVRAADGHPTGPMGGCGLPMHWTYAYRCTECGRFFHRHCALRHFAGSPASGHTTTGGS